MNMRSDDCCGLCVYCRDINMNLTNPTGVCKVFPPTTMYDQVEDSAFTLPRPSVELNDWCGCFKRLQES